MNDSQIVDQLPAEIDVYPMSSIELFERAFCTNFSCCNILFPDLHALLDHYDATTTAHSHDCFPTPLSLSYSPASSPPSSPSTHHSTPAASPPHRRPVSLVCTNIDAPLSPVLLNSHLHMSLSLNPTLAQPAMVPGLAPMVHPYIYHPDAYALADYPAYEYCYDTATRYLASARGPGAESSAPLEAQSSDPGPGIGIGSIGKCVGGASKTRRRRSSLPSSPSSLSQSSSSDAGVPSPTKKKRGKADLAGASLPGPRRRRRSQKAYQCPVPGCSKSYLNPNGLKYHQEKGKCKIELPVEHSPPVFVADAANSTGMGIKLPSAPSAVPVPFGLPTADHHEQQQQVRIHHPQPRHAVLQWPPSTVKKHRSSELDSESELELESELAGHGDGESKVQDGARDVRVEV